MEILSAIHSSLRYVLLVVLLLAIAQSWSGWFGKKAFTPNNRKTVLYTVIVTHLQLVIGLILYFIHPLVNYKNMGEAMKEPVTRFFTVEHLAMMLVAIILITMGSAMSKRGKTDEAKHKRVAIFFTISLLIILASIPWPFMAKFNGLIGWF
ncbi:MAG: hypothetical protein FD123_2492 [Bacteroidetes bacterium]|nr:MAG: hypothetical protein FD123_2492 [Bacteroidota bacterium]